MKQLVLDRSKLKNINPELINGRDVFVGFNEPEFKISSKRKNIYDLDSKLNARFITHFLPAVDIARVMKKRPRLFIVSAINMALLWNAHNEEEKKIMLANNSIKIDFLRNFFDRFFTKTFSLIEIVVSQDILKITKKEIDIVSAFLSEDRSDEMLKAKYHLARFIYPKEFNKTEFRTLSKEKRRIDEIDLSRAIKYALSHAFLFGDVNFEGNYIHNDIGYISIGNESEEFFNVIRDILYKFLAKYGELIFSRKIILKNNLKVVVSNKFRVPPPYNGMYKDKGSKKNRVRELCEVTYENKRRLDYYNSQEKLKDQMEYMYKNLISKKDYEMFWNNYKERYFDLKKRYKEAYGIRSDW